jgi:hypothetical protein
MAWAATLHENPSREHPPNRSREIAMIIELGKATEETGKFFGHIDFLVHEQP